MGGCGGGRGGRACLCCVCEKILKTRNSRGLHQNFSVSEILGLSGACSTSLWFCTDGGL